jgi:hypothetical protein
MKQFRFPYHTLCLCGIVVSLAFCTSNPKQAAASEPTALATNQPPTAAISNEIKPTEIAEAPDATPKPGKWVATVSNGYKGDKLTFTVSADGKRVENVEFTGHWRSRSSRTEVLMNLDPPNPFAISKGSFSAVQREESAGMWWEFIGNFTSATAAEGSYRCTFAGGENDTYKLKWTAKYIGAK